MVFFWFENMLRCMCMCILQQTIIIIVRFESANEHSFKLEVVIPIGSITCAAMLMMMTRNQYSSIVVVGFSSSPCWCLKQ